MGKCISAWATLAVLFASASIAQAQQVRAEVGITTERQGISLNVDGRYYHSKYKLFALGRLFISEPDNDALKQPISNDNALSFEAVAGRFFRTGSFMIGPLAGMDSNKRVLAGADLSTKVYRHTVAYIGYGKFATDATHVNGSRHRLMIDLKRDQKFFLRLDWKTELSRQGHLRLGVEFNTRIDKLNLPVLVEPFWNFRANQVGLRLGTRL